MCAELSFPLTLDYVQTTSPVVILAAVKSWLEQENPICLEHPHGFYVVLLGRTETEEWRFHYWPEGPRSIVGMPGLIHTHNCHVESRVLQGQLTNALYDVATLSTGGYPLYQVVYGGDRYRSATSNILRRTATRVQPIVRDRQTVERGDMYHVERHAYHEAIVPVQIPTATVVCMHGRTLEPVMVIGLDGYPETIDFKRAERRARTFVARLSP